MGLAAVLIGALIAGCTGSPDLWTVDTTTPTEEVPVTQPSALTDTQALVSPTGVVLPVTATVEDGWRVLTPCGASLVIPSSRATPEPELGAPEVFAPGTFRAVGPVQVVIDPGHGGDTEPGAVAGNGIQEADVNLAVAELAAELLEAGGISAQLTRESDHRLPIAARAATITTMEPELAVSVHHNGGEANRASVPGSIMFHQLGSPASRRFAGLLAEEAVTVLDVHDIDWFTSSDAGATTRAGENGGDFYGILRETPEVPTVLAELTYLSNPAEASLLDTEGFRSAEASVISRAVVRWLQTDAPGSRFAPPVARSSAGGGGGGGNCTDPELGVEPAAPAE